MCSYVVLKNVSIFLIVVTTLPSVVVPIVVMLMTICLCWLVFCPHRLLSTFKNSMSILLAILVVIFKSWCPYGSSPMVMCLMSLLIAFVTVTLVLGFVLLIGLISPTHIRGMSLFTTKMTSGFFFLPLSLLSSIVLDDSPSSMLVYPSPEVSLLDLGDFSSYSK